MRVAITNVGLEDKQRSLPGYTPTGSLATTALNAAGARTALSSAAVEAAFLDAASQERLGDDVDRSISDQIAESEQGEGTQKDVESKQQVGWETVQ